MVLVCLTVKVGSATNWKWRCSYTRSNNPHCTCLLPLDYWELMNDCAFPLPECSSQSTYRDGLTICTNPCDDIVPRPGRVKCATAIVCTWPCKQEYSITLYRRDVDRSMSVPVISYTWWKLPVLAGWLSYSLGRTSPPWPYDTDVHIVLLVLLSHTSICIRNHF